MYTHEAEYGDRHPVGDDDSHNKNGADDLGVIIAYLSDCNQQC